MKAHLSIFWVLAAVAFASGVNAEPLCKTITREVFISYFPVAIQGDNGPLGPNSPGDFSCLGIGGQCPKKLTIEVGSDSASVETIKISALCHDQGDLRVCPLKAGQAIKITTEKGVYPFTVGPDDQITISTRPNGFYDCSLRKP